MLHSRENPPDGGVVKLRHRARHDKTAARQNHEPFCARMIERFAPLGAPL